MATGDIRNNLKKLQKQVSLIRYPNEIDYDGLTKGDVSAHLPLLYHVFFNYSPIVVENMSKLNYNITGKKNSDFMNAVFKVMRELNSSYHVSLKVTQFMSKGYAEHKIILTMNIIKFIRTCPKLSKSSSKVKVRSKTESDVTSSSQVQMQTNLRNHSAAGSNMDTLSCSSISTTQNQRSKLRSISDSDTYASRFQSTSTSVNGSLSTSQLNSSINMQPSIVRHVPMLEIKEEAINNETDDDAIQDEDVYSLILGVSDDVTRMKEGMMKENKELKTENQELKSRLESLESELKTECSEMRKEIKELKSLQQPQIDFNNIIARLDVFEARFKSIESKEEISSANPGHHSPVCGFNLCHGLKNLHLPSDESINDISQTSDNNDNSLLDLSNESPCRKQFRQKSTKLLELVQGTRSLLGLSDNIERIKFVPEKKEQETENQPPPDSAVPQEQA